MKFKTTSKEIKEFVLSVSRAVDIKPSNPSLQGIYLRVFGGFCELIGTDLDLVIKLEFSLHLKHLFHLQDLKAFGYVVYLRGSLGNNFLVYLLNNQKLQADLS